MRTGVMCPWDILPVTDTDTVTLLASGFELVVARHIAIGHSTAHGTCTDYILLLASK